MINEGWRVVLKDFDGSPNEVDSIWDRRFPVTGVLDTHLCKGKDQVKMKKLEFEITRLKGDNVGLEEKNKTLENEKKILKEAQDKALSDLKSNRTSLQEAETKLVAKLDEIEDLKQEISFQISAGFDKELSQITFLYPDVDLIEVGLFKIIKYGKLIDRFNKNEKSGGPPPSK
ncbi:hypothetical protein SESBI_43717 [Sesbania bispinosa]|nr:hypothetical protein SESBI_43717 [Sesbania bispinosa]